MILLNRKTINSFNPGRDQLTITIVEETERCRKSVGKEMISPKPSRDVSLNPY